MKIFTFISIINVITEYLSTGMTNIEIKLTVKTPNPWLMLTKLKTKQKQDMTVPFARARAKLGGSIC